MQQQLPNPTRPPGLIAKVLGVLLLIGLVVVGFMVSIVALAVAAALLLIGGGYFWWKTRHLRRELKQQMQTMQQSRNTSSENAGEIIEGEFIREVPPDEPEQPR